jgi:preprotein translocase subunit SecY
VDLALFIKENNLSSGPTNLISTFLGDKSIIIGLFTLNIFPSINASILIQFLIGFSPQLNKLQKEGDFQGRRAITTLTRKITLALAIIQSTGIALYLYDSLFDFNLMRCIRIIIWLTAGAMIVLWLSEIISTYGLGNGTSVLIYTNIVSNLPNLAHNIINEWNENSFVISSMSKIGFGLLISLALCAVVFLQSSILIIYLISSKRLNQISNRYDDYENDGTYIPFRFNQAGVMPVILTTSFLVIPNYLINLGVFQGLNFLQGFQGIYWIGYFILILSFSSFYSSLVLNAKDLSEQLQQQAVKIPGVRPGIQTIFYLQQEIRRITLIGATILAFITIVPNFIESSLHITSLNGLSTTSFLILAGVILDLKREIGDIYLSEVYSDMY